MTLDLRGFELGGEIGDTGEAPGAHDPVSAVLDVLGQAFGVVTEHAAPGSGARQHTWLDTFDWRLNRAGLVLDYEHTRRDGRLLLSKDEVTVAEQPVSGWRSSRPRLASLRIWSRTGPAGRSAASRGRLDRQPETGCSASGTSSLLSSRRPPRRVCS